MCELIDESIYNKKKVIQKQQDNEDEKQNMNILTQKSSCNFKIIGENKNRNNKNKRFGVIEDVVQNLDILVQMERSNNKQRIRCKNLYNQKEYKILDKQSRIVIANQLIKKSILTNIQSAKINFSIHNGQIYIIHQLYITQQYNKSPNKIINKTISHLVDCSVQLFKFINNLIQHQNILNKFVVQSNNSKYQFSGYKQNYRSQNNVSRQKNKIKKFFQKVQFQIVQDTKMYNLLKYFNSCTIEPSISVKSQCVQYQTLVHRYAASQYDLNSLIQFNKNSHQITSSLFNNLSLYGLNTNIDKKSYYLNQISLSQKQKIQSQIIIPALYILRPKQNKYLFNHCYFLNHKYSQRKIEEGGNSQIFIIKPQIYEYSSTNIQKQDQIIKNQNINNYLSKHLIYKKLKSAHNTQLPVKQKIYKKISHEAQILSWLKGSSCQYLPKYYLNVQRQSPYYNQLFIEYIYGQNLDQFIQNHTSTISLVTKIWLIFQVVQSLRFMGQFGIVHLDVKEKNIIIMKKLVCKIFDFGQSYHFKVCGSNHKPKYTLLYASPQVVTSMNGRVFTSKSDTYSLGIMMHKIFFGRYPYFFRDQNKFQRSNLEKSLRQKTFYLPEYGQNMPYKQVMEILSQLILKCIDMDEKKRPYLDWIGIVLKYCLNLILSQ